MVGNLFYFDDTIKQAKSQPIHSIVVFNINTEEMISMNNTQEKSTYKLDEITIKSIF